MRANNKNILIAWATFGLLGFLAFREFLLVNILAYVDYADLWLSKRFIVFLAGAVVSLFLWAAFNLWYIRGERETPVNWLNASPLWLKVILSAVVILTPSLAKWIIPLPENFQFSAWMMIFLFYISSILVAGIFTIRDRSLGWFVPIGIIFMLGGVGYSLLSKINLVTGYPFTTYWSEGNRFFDYSTLLGSYRYLLGSGEGVYAFTNWAMQLPWALPFVSPNLSIGAFRLWNQLVWILPTLLLGYTAIEKGHKKISLLIAGVFACWVYLFLDQGPIYVPLVIAAILTIIAVRLPISPGIVLVIVASYYARSARWTWGYAPGIFAGMLSLLEIQNPSFRKGEIKALIKPVVLGLAGYFGGYLLPAIVKAFTVGKELKLIQDPSGSLSRQPLLWDRLWPNLTYPPGIIIGIVWAALPVIFLLTAAIAKKQWKINWMQILSFAAVGIILLTVGIIASTKIGGGSNLHNLDMFLVSIVLLVSALVNYRLTHASANQPLSMLVTMALLIALVAPVTYSLQKSDRMELPSAVKTNESMNAVQNKVAEYSEEGEILFIDHRQLLTFGLVENVPLVNDYEKKVLMDRAMADNSAYFAQFYEDIYHHRFALIVNEPANNISRGSEYSFGEENDAYVKWVTIPLLCTYEPIYTSQSTTLELLVPRTSQPLGSLRCDDIFNVIE